MLGILSANAKNLTHMGSPRHVSHLFPPHKTAGFSLTTIPKTSMTPWPGVDTLGPRVLTEARTLGDETLRLPGLPCALLCALGSISPASHLQRGSGWEGGGRWAAVLLLS